MKKIVAEYFFVGFVSVLVGLTANLTYLLSCLHIPPTRVYLGVTHYWNDYMYYLSQFMEGARGSFFNHSLFTEEPLTPNLLHWPNRLLGWTGQLGGLSIIDSYNISVIILVIGICLLAYWVLKKLFGTSRYALPAFLFFVTATSLMNKLSPAEAEAFFPFYLWATPHLLFTRFGATPHSLTQTWLCFVLLFLLFLPKQEISLMVRRTVTPLLITLLTIIHPWMSLIFLGSYWVTVVLWKKDNDRITTIGTTLACFATTVYLFITLSMPPATYARVWEAQQQVTTTLWFLLASIGPVVPFVLVGMIKRIKTYTPLERFGAFLLVACYGTFLSPLPKLVGISNVRVLFPSLYIFIAWFAAVGLETMAVFITKWTRLKKPVVEAMLLLVFLLAETPTLIWEVQKKAPDPRLYSDVLYFMPASTYEAFTFLEHTGKQSDIVLGNPASHTPLLIGAFGGHKTTYGYDLTTIDSEVKFAEALKIFTHTLTPDAAKEWLLTHRVRYILCTVNCGDCPAIERAYPFLGSPIFLSATARVWEVK